MFSTVPMTPPGPIVWLWTALAMGLALVCVVWLLPRLTGRMALWVSGLSVIVGVTVALAWPGSGWFAALPVTAMVFGHIGHVARRQRATAPPINATPGAVPTSRRPARALVAAASSATDRPPEPLTASAPDAASADATSATAKPLATLGRYRIDGELGRGSMGAVYLGHDPQIGRQVALKTLALSREFQGDKLAEARRRFFREAETAGRLQHPDIVTIFDAGESQDLAYIAMEYIQGADLQRHATPDRLLPWTEVLAVGARVADALAYAHRQGVVHRDVKPANVMVNLETSLVKVTDFGIARITDAARTRTGLVLGTPSYMSPEQMAGRRIDGRTDLYSLGVMLFELLTGTAAAPGRVDGESDVPDHQRTCARPAQPEAGAAAGAGRHRGAGAAKARGGALRRRPPDGRRPARRRGAGTGSGKRRLRENRDAFTPGSKAQFRNLSACATDGPGRDRPILPCPCLIPPRT